MSRDIPIFEIWAHDPLTTEKKSQTFYINLVQSLLQFREDASQIWNYS